MALILHLTVMRLYLDKLRTPRLGIVVLANTLLVLSILFRFETGEHGAGVVASLIINGIANPPPPPIWLAPLLKGPDQGEIWNMLLYLPVVVVWWQMARQAGKIDRTGYRTGGPT
jgi:hypothetical protein